MLIARPRDRGCLALQRELAPRDAGTRYRLSLAGIWLVEGTVAPWPRDHK